MSTETLGTKSAGQTIVDTWFNTIKAALSGNLLPRNQSGIPTDESGYLGSETVKWLKAYIACGEWTTGDIKAHHTFNGEELPGEGWMLCDGRIVAEAAYDTEHGAGAWAAYVGTSPMNGKYLPNLVSRYPVGKATTTQTGASAITPVGNAGSVRDFQHTHKYYAAPSTNKNYNSIGAPITPTTGGGGKVNFKVGLSVVGSGGSSQDLYVQKMLSTAQSVQPESIEVVYFMRII